MYCVKFILNDGSPDQQYWYHREEDAKYHFHLFDDDISEMYFAVELLDENRILLIHIIQFSRKEIAYVISTGITDQTELCLYLSLSTTMQKDFSTEEMLNLRYKIEQLSFDWFEKYIGVFKTITS